MAPDFPGYLEFIPMLWGSGGDKVGPVRAHSPSLEHLGTSRLTTPPSKHPTNTTTTVGSQRKQRPLPRLRSPPLL